MAKQEHKTLSDALYRASEYGRADRVRHLIQQGACVSAPGDKGWHAIHVASYHGNNPVVEVLLASKANVDARTNTGHPCTSLFLAALMGHVTTAKTLITHGADVNTPVSTKEETSADVTCQVGMTPLMVASEQGHLDMVRLLLRKGASVNTQKRNGWHALLLATTGGHNDVVNCLLGARADPEIVNNKGFTCLMEACERGHYDIVLSLIEAGSNVNARVKTSFRPQYANTAMSGAAKNGHVQILELLLDNGAREDTFRWNALHTACFNNNPICVSLLLDRGYDVGAYTNDGRKSTPLFLASWNGHSKVATMLIERGADVNGSNGKGGMLPIHIASKHGHIETIQLLLQRGADINMVDVMGDSCLHRASSNGQVDTVKLLLANGADVNKMDHRGLKPKEVTCKSLHAKAKYERKILELLQG